MTKAQIKKLESILSRVECLQNEVSDASIKDYIGKAKNELLSALRKA